MDLGIIGYQRSGKTTIFNAVTRGDAATGSYGAGVQPNIGVVKVPDDRLDRLAKLFDPKKFTLADIRYVDFPGDAFSSGQGPSPQFLAQLARSEHFTEFLGRGQIGRLSSGAGSREHTDLLHEQVCPGRTAQGMSRRPWGGLREKCSN